MRYYLGNRYFYNAKEEGETVFYDRLLRKPELAKQYTKDEVFDYVEANYGSMAEYNVLAVNPQESFSLPDLTMHLIVTDKGILLRDGNFASPTITSIEAFDYLEEHARYVARERVEAVLTEFALLNPYAIEALPFLRENGRKGGDDDSPYAFCPVCDEPYVSSAYPEDYKSIQSFGACKACLKS